MNFVAFDIETTGFMPGADQIVEIAGVRFVNGKPTEAYSSLVNPGMRIPPGAMRIHGITDEMVQGQPHIEEALEKFAEFCKQDVLVAHNAPFDAEFIKANINRFETPAPRGIILDSCAMARKVIAGAPNYKLGTLVSFLGIPKDGAFHRAEADARFCGTLFQMMLERIFRAGDPIVVENLINLSGGTVMKFPQVTRQLRQLDLLGEL